ncbi:uroporphyrinogen decarboxylase [Pseudaquidulcibacter saccharophilus]|uniref:uroporphyrinogen decarboxylase n=1 Tax=Pseudaquidulcibacter saccharophilus TaxID=2831900 RepID=UPI001EFEFACD|nr:uroporphyrinogen decarboxylase [Pseudaquidulcibacter saccharophilus]
MKKVLIETLEGNKTKRVPIWMMRQAGRHLPEYKELRARNKSFLDFCYAPAAAAEATLQPVRRYDIDAAIIFSDILVIPHALGQFVDFKEGIGPILEPINTLEGLKTLEGSKFAARLAPVYEAIERVRGTLDAEKTLLGFCGAPWTLATYIIQGKGGNRDVAKIHALQNPEFMNELFDMLIEYCALHLAAQLDAGADAVQIFESWAEDLNDECFQNLVIEPNRKLVARLRELRPNAKIIGFPRGASHRAKYYYPQTGVNAVGLDISADLKTIRSELGNEACIQGNLDPLVLVAGGDGLKRAVENIMETAALGPHIFNLGHGIVPQTPIDNVIEMIKTVRSFEGK